MYTEEYRTLVTKSLQSWNYKEFLMPKKYTRGTVYPANNPRGKVIEYRIRLHRKRVKNPIIFGIAQNWSEETAKIELYNRLQEATE